LLHKGFPFLYKPVGGPSNPRRSLTNRCPPTWKTHGEEERRKGSSRTVGIGYAHTHEGGTQSSKGARKNRTYMQKAKKENNRRKNEKRLWGQTLGVGTHKPHKPRRH